MIVYIYTSSAYGFTRKTIQLSDAKVTTYSGKERPMLFTDKGAASVWAGVGAIYLWPLYSYQNVRNIEVKWRSIDIIEPEVFGDRFLAQVTR